jgi:hypothetical protein
MRYKAVLFVALLTLGVAGCGSDQASSPTSSSDTRSAILVAVEKGEYDGLRSLIDADTFLSDYGFGKEKDPVARWEAMGPKPLETMGVLLRMPHVVRETNEGTLYQWPKYGPDSRASDLTAEDRDLFRTVMSKEELDQLILPELGYTGPRLGILDDGKWWFFILHGEG